ncbi:uncharacterized protein BX663DRAFT_516306 [Cokeromyces recurvatus]|uniref:uncharacterized protein n=1 Tax=Cokeromyces recurvatus TaxID=90255 RepID=UPI00221E8514|nr:uncharacterized protein BX663DRAFT_516306 [Cokeromyces recurvatus]KAI7900729.1 hypothetical protein BX663DRAFT_516306 [Cokeromyces recurvatus]
MSVNSKDYTYYKYIDQESINHPSIDGDSTFSISSLESIDPSNQSRSDIIYRSYDLACDSTLKSSVSEPIHCNVTLTEEELARHNDELSPFSSYQFNREEEEEEIDDNNVLKEQLQTNYDSIIDNRKLVERLKRFEKEFITTEYDNSNPTHLNSKELTNLQSNKYINPNVQKIRDKIETTLVELSIDPSPKVKERLKECIAKAKKKNPNWELPLLHLDLICNNQQLPTSLEDIEHNHQDICDYHREKLKVKLFKEEKTTKIL